MSKKKTKPRAPRKTFSERLADKLRESGLGEVEEVREEESCYVNFRIGDKELEISFSDKKGEKIDHIGVYEDVVEVVDQKRIFGSNQQ